MAVAAYKRYQAKKEKRSAVATNAINGPAIAYSDNDMRLQARESDVQLPPPYEDVAYAKGQERPSAGEKVPMGM